MSTRTLLVVSATVDDEARQAVADGRWPNKDFLDLADRLQADVIDYRVVERSPFWRLVRRFVGPWPAQVLIAFARAARYNAVVTDGEHLGLPLALLLRFSRRRPRHVMIGHLLSTPFKQWLFRRLRPQSQIDRVLVHSSSQYQAAVEETGLPAERLALVPYQIDPAFWSPRPARAADPPSQPARTAPGTDPTICTVGLEYRDYPTLLVAIRDLPVRLVIAAGSRWSRHRSTADDAPLPPNVEVTSLDYAALRDLYAGARFVVVPLQDVENQAGITTILEAMAMGKAVIVTATRGQRDVIRGRLFTAQGPSSVAQGGPAAFGVTGPLAEAETGIYVRPGDSEGLRRAIQFLLDRPEEAERMGANGRLVVERHMSLELFGRRIAEIVSDLDRARRAPDARSGARRPRRAAAGQPMGRK